MAGNWMRLYIGNKVYSSWSLRPWMVMRAHGIAFEEYLLQLRAGDTADRIRSVSPSGKVPALVDGETLVWDSLAIMEYLADKFPDKAIWPRDVNARAHARCVSAEMHSGFQALRGQCQMTITKRFKASKRSPEVMADVARITALWTEARTRFGIKATGADAGPFLYGSFTAADGMFAPVVARFHTYSIPVEAAALAYMAAVRTHPAYVAWVTDATKEPWVLADNDEPVIEDLRAK
jgi:glutathione S-transferase